LRRNPSMAASADSSDAACAASTDAVRMPNTGGAGLRPNP